MVVEYKDRNLKAILFTESLQIIQSLRCSLVHYSLQLSAQVWDGQGRSLILCSVNYFGVDLDICLVSLCCWKVWRWPSFTFLAGAARFRFKMSWCLKFMMPCTLTMFPGPLEEKQPHNIREPPPQSYLRTGYSWYRHSSFYTKSTLSVGCRKA